jgi:drug/metabolite transporter (DMT)-like permease
MSGGRTRALNIINFSIKDVNAGDSPSAKVISKDGSQQAIFRDKLVTASLICLWYAASVVCNQTSKTLLNSQVVSGSALTLLQTLFAAGCGLLCFASNLSPFDGFKDKQQFVNISFLAAIYSLGFYLFNSCVSAMHVSMVMVLRSAEPLTTLALSVLLGGLAGSSLPPPGRLAALFLTVAGCALSAFGEHGPTPHGLLLALAANVCFSLRGILGKRFLSTAGGMHPVALFFHLAWIGSCFQAAMLVGSSLLQGGSTIGALTCAPTVTDLPVLLLNGASFFTYIQLSWVCLGRMSAVSHSVANSLRRPATIAAALLLAPAPMSLLNFAGMALACIGALLYGLL